MEDDPKKNGRRPKKTKIHLKKIKKGKMEDDLNKMEDEPINQIQPNWL
jgi:hypothetical protein